MRFPRRRWLSAAGFFALPSTLFAVCIFCSALMHQQEESGCCQDDENSASEEAGAEDSDAGPHEDEHNPPAGDTSKTRQFAVGEIAFVTDLQGNVHQFCHWIAHEQRLTLVPKNEDAGQQKQCVAVAKKKNRIPVEQCVAQFGEFALRFVEDGLNFVYGGDVGDSGTDVGTSSTLSGTLRLTEMFTDFAASCNEWEKPFEYRDQGPVYLLLGGRDVNKMRFGPDLWDLWQLEKHGNLTDAPDSPWYKDYVPGFGSFGENIWGEDLDDPREAVRVYGLTKVERAREEIMGDGGEEEVFTAFETALVTLVHHVNKHEASAPDDLRFRCEEMVSLIRSTESASSSSPEMEGIRLESDWGQLCDFPGGGKDGGEEGTNKKPRKPAAKTTRGKLLPAAAWMYHEMMRNFKDCGEDAETKNYQQVREKLAKTLPSALAKQVHALFARFCGKTFEYLKRGRLAVYFPEPKALFIHGPPFLLDKENKAGSSLIGYKPLFNDMWRTQIRLSAKLTQAPLLVGQTDTYLWPAKGNKTGDWISELQTWKDDEFAEFLEWGDSKKGDAKFQRKAVDWERGTGLRYSVWHPVWRRFVMDFPGGLLMLLGAPAANPFDSFLHPKRAGLLHQRHDAPNCGYEPPIEDWGLLPVKTRAVLKEVDMIVHGHDPVGAVPAFFSIAREYENQPLLVIQAALSPAGDGDNKQEHQSQFAVAVLLPEEGVGMAAAESEGEGRAGEGASGSSRAEPRVQVKGTAFFSRKFFDVEEERRDSNSSDEVDHESVSSGNKMEVNARLPWGKCEGAKQPPDDSPGFQEATVGYTGAGVPEKKPELMFFMSKNFDVFQHDWVKIDEQSSDLQRPVEMDFVVSTRTSGSLVFRGQAQEEHVALPRPFCYDHDNSRFAYLLPRGIVRLLGPGSRGAGEGEGDGESEALGEGEGESETSQAQITESLFWMAGPIENVWKSGGGYGPPVGGGGYAGPPVVHLDVPYSVVAPPGFTFTGGEGSSSEEGKSSNSTAFLQEREELQQVEVGARGEVDDVTQSRGPGAGSCDDRSAKETSKARHRSKGSIEEQGN